MNVRNLRGKLLSLYGMMFCLAFGTVLLGVLTPQISSAYGLPAEKIGWAAAFQSAGGIAALILGSILLGRMESYSATLVFFFGLCASLAVMWRIPPFPLFLGAAFVFGAFQQLLMVTITVSVSALFPNSAQRWITLAHTIYGIGSVLAPLYSGMLAAGQRWNLAFLTSALLGVVFLISGSVLRGRTAFLSSAGQKQTSEGIRMTKLLAALCMAAFCYMGQLGLVSIWLPVYLTDLGISNVGITLSGFWLGVVLGRMGYSFIGASVEEKKTIRLGCAAGAMILAAALWLGGGFGWICAAVAFGVVTGPLLPVLLSLPAVMLRGGASSATSIVLLVGTVGNLLCVWLAGILAQAFGTGWVMLGAVLLLVLMIPLAGVFQKEKTM